MARREWVVWSASVIWLAVGIIAIWSSERYEATPGTMGSGLSSSPGDGRWHLHVFAHPRCPCLSGTLEELAALSVTETCLRVRVWIVVPPGAPASWAESRNATAARAIPGVEVVVDDGTAARGWGAETSGHAVLIDPSGMIRLRGGLSAGRGHGPPVGQVAVRNRIRGTETARLETPVYGCPLLTPKP